MKQILICWLLCLFVNCSTDAVETLKSPPEETPLCSREILLTFFPKPIVEPILAKHEIDTKLANDIADKLTTKDGEIISIVEKKALNKITGKEPLLSPEEPTENLREAGVRLFKESLYQVFAKTLDDSGVKKSDAEIKTMLDEILETKGKLFLKCVHKTFPGTADT